MIINEMNNKAMKTRLMNNPELNSPLPDTIRPIRFADQTLYLLDQRELPGRLHEQAYQQSSAVADAIRSMVVRGAPAIGITAAFGVVLACRQARISSAMDWRAQVAAAMDELAASRPTAVNLFWALAQMRAIVADCADADHAYQQTLKAAEAMLADDIAANRRMGVLGAAFIEPGKAVLTHCNTGSLATGGFGTALGVVRTAWAQGRIQQVFADETRPWLQGARLTAWELAQDQIPVQLLCEGAAAALLASGQISWVIVGADRIAANGDTANKIGTYGLALMARALGVHFMVVAPTSTLDFAAADGAAIPIELRSEEEVTRFGGQPVAPAGVRAWNPAFDITPADLIDVLVTERGTVLQPSREQLQHWQPA